MYNKRIRAGIAGKNANMERQEEAEKVEDDVAVAEGVGGRAVNATGRRSLTSPNHIAPYPWKCDKDRRRGGRRRRSKRDCCASAADCEVRTSNDILLEQIRPQRTDTFVTSNILPIFM